MLMLFMLSIFGGVERLRAIWQINPELPHSVRNLPVVLVSRLAFPTARTTTTILTAITAHSVQKRTGSLIASLCLPLLFRASGKLAMPGGM
jgi:hypothetical protein